jgi:hypothetical protein
MAKENNSSRLAALKAFKESMYASNREDMLIDGADKEEEEIKIKEVSLAEDELLAFNNVPDCAYLIEDIKSQSEIEKFSTSFFKGFLGDTIKSSLVYRTYNGISRWVIKLDFRFSKDPIVNEDGTELAKAIISSFVPSKDQGIFETLMAINQNQRINAYDASKYASISKDAKAFLTMYLFFTGNNKKKRWVRGEHYDITNLSQTAYNGVKYNNIIGSVYLDAETVLNTFCCTKDNKKKYKFALEQIACKTNGQDVLFVLKRISKKFRNRYQNDYGISFTG